jgi:tungstate transport system ATP-binding protein
MSDISIDPACVLETGGTAARAVPIETRALTLLAGDRNLVDAVDLTISGGGLTVVMGPNGAGKSLLLKLLHGLLKPTSGAVLCDGMPLGPEVRARQAMVFQKPVLLRRSTGENVDFVLRTRNRRGRERRDRLLEHVGLADRVDQPARLLSGGEQQRLALARALATEPDVLFLDEPTASLDPASVLKIEEVVTSAQARGTKVVFVTHDVAQAKRLADDVVFLGKGRLIERGRAGLFFEEPRTKAARDYLAGRLVA